MKNKKSIFLIVLTMVAVVIAISSFLSNDIICITASLLPMAVIGNIEDVNDREAAGKQIACRTWLLSVDQLDRSVPFPKPNTSREVGDVALKQGEFWHYIEAHTHPTNDSTMEKGDINTVVTNTYSLIIGGASSQTLNFIENHIGGKFIVVSQDVETGVYNIQGSDTRPMYLKSAARSNNAEKKTVELKFENNSFCQPYLYVGSLATQTPTNVTANVIVITSNSRYIINGSAAVTGVSGLTANDVGRHIVFLGGTSATPATIAESTTFILIDGTTWTAKEGSKLELKVLDANTLVEIEGTRVQRV